MRCSHPHLGFSQRIQQVLIFDSDVLTAVQDLQRPFRLCTQSKKASKSHDNATFDKLQA
jgi:hypothetical protein